MKKNVKVSLGCKSQIIQFINMNSKSSCEIDVQDGHSYIDGKSIVGLLSLNLFKPLDVTVIGDDKKITDLIASYGTHQLLIGWHSLYVNKRDSNESGPFFYEYF